MARSLFHEPKHDWLGDIITWESTKAAREAAKRLLSALERGHIGKLKIGQKRALAIARALQNAANGAKAAAKKRGLKSKTKKRLRSVAKVYDRAAERAFRIYREKYSAKGKRGGRR